MVKRRIVRLLAVAGLLASVSVTRPARAQLESPCGVLCLALAGASGYVGEEVIWYYAGCVLGCYAAGI